MTSSGVDPLFEDEEQLHRLKISCYEWMALTFACIFHS